MNLDDVGLRRIKEESIKEQLTKTTIMISDAVKDHKINVLIYFTSLVIYTADEKRFAKNFWQRKVWFLFLLTFV